MKKRWPVLMSIALCMSMVTACGSSSSSSGEGVAVQSVSMLMGMDISGSNRYTGVVESKSTVKIEKDSDKAVSEIYVEEGQEVKKGDKLFSYDAESLNLSVETAELEVEQLQSQISSYTTQMSELEKERNSAASSDKLSYTLQIQETQLDQAEAEYNLKQKQKELDKLKAAAEDSDVYATVDGVVRSISSSDDSTSDYYDYGGEDQNAFITIMETGTYRIKGTVSETNVYDLYEEEPVLIVSRTDSSQTWSGTISLIDTENTADSENSSAVYYDEGSGESASKYNFYIDLESSDGLMMGQHIYIVADDSGIDPSQIVLPSSFIVTEDGNAYVWAAASGDKLEKRAVTLGDYDETTDAYVILDGLTLDDYIADPSDDVAAGKAVVKYDAESYSFSEDGEEDTYYEDEEYMEEDGEYSDDEYIEEDGEYSDDEYIEEDGEVYEDNEIYDETEEE